MNREQRRKAAKKIGKQSRGLPARDRNLPPNALLKALSLHKGGQLARAKAAYEQILQSEPENSRVLNYLGVLKGQMGEVNGAVRPLMAAVRIEPENAGYLNNLGNSYRAADRLNEAIACYQRALQAG